ncbi:hypothetical protein Tco_1337196 [Tanacetum coccineum]
MMDDSNITMEEYIKLQAEMAQRCGHTFNWETATYSKSYCDDLDFFTDFEVDYPAIVYNDALTSNENVPSKPPISIYNAIQADIDFSISFSDPDDEEMLMEHRDAQGQSVFTSRAWRWLFEVRVPLVHELGGARCRMSWREFILGTGLHTAEEIEFTGFDAYRAESARQIPNKGDLSAYWRGILSKGDFLGTTLSYTTIKDLMLRLCHRGMDVGSVNIPYHLARYLCRFALGRKRGAMIFGGQIVACLICDELDDTWVWVAPGPKRQPDAVVGALEVTEGASDINEARTLPHRVARLKEQVHGMREALGMQREVLDSMARDFSRFAIWTISSLSLMMDKNGVRYTSYFNFRKPYQQRVRRRTGEANTLAAPLDEDQLDP